MKLAVFTSGVHPPKCSGCPACSEAMAELLLSSSERRALAAHFARLPLASYAVRTTAAATAPAPPSLRAAIERRAR